jgi:peptidoglycan/xylan/chitin deacetylase (PgdA/CDA1 family)
LAARSKMGSQRSVPGFQDGHYLKNVVYNVFSAARLDHVAFRLSRNRLRILAYHGICQDRLAEEPWVPPHFVTCSAFESQLDYLQRHYNVLSLHDAVNRLRDNKLPERSVAITFDDGYANNLRLAYPLLRKYRMPATIFLITDHMESGEFFIFDRIRLIRNDAGVVAGAHGVREDDGLSYGTGPLEALLERVQEKWSKVAPRISPEQRETLQPLRVADLQMFDSHWVEFGAHTHRHAILRDEPLTQREWEISMSIERIRQWTHRPVRLFSYPRGNRGDFGEADKRVLLAKGVEAAVTGISGANRTGCDLYGLRRYGVGLNHSGNAFIAEVAGFRTLLNSLMGRNTKVYRKLRESTFVNWSTRRALH